MPPVLEEVPSFDNLHLASMERLSAQLEEMEQGQGANIFGELAPDWSLNDEE